MFNVLLAQSSGFTIGPWCKTQFRRDIPANAEFAISTCFWNFATKPNELAYLIAASIGN